MRRVFILLLIVGIAVGSWGDRPLDNQPLKLGQFYVIEADFHVHSFLGDGFLSPINLVLEAQRRGLHAFALTNHNQVIAARLARWFARKIDGPIVLVGQEITAPGWHIAAAGLQRTVSWRTGALEAIRKVHDQGGVAISAHPVAEYWPALSEAVIAELDGAEMQHPLVQIDEQRKKELGDFFYRARQTNPGLAAIGSSDFHAMQSLGICRTLVFVTSLNEEGVLEAIRRGRTVVFDQDSRAHGDASLIRLLAGRAPKISAQPTLFRVAGGIAWTGLAGWLFLGTRDPDARGRQVPRKR